MPTWKPRTDRRAIRPGAEALEGRRLLAATVRGVDIDGDAYVLRLSGPGDLLVVNQPDATGVPVAIGQPGLIDQITVAGGSPGTTKLIGLVQRGNAGDGRVFFENLVELGNAGGPQVIGNGLLAIDLPDFFLGITNPTQTVPAGTPRASISVPDGVVTLRLGGVDTTAFFGTGTAPNLNNQNDVIAINLGLPQSIGTTIDVGRVVTANQAATTPTGIGTRDTVNFNVAGRINLFQADEIVGDPTLTDGPFDGNNPGGTFVNSTQDQSTGVTGAIGTVRIGGNATNFSVSASGQSGNDRIQTFFIGGETNKVSVQAGVGVRVLKFGKGFDTVNVQTGLIESLSANRGALNSQIIASDNVDRLTIGGDVVNTNVFSGYVTAANGALNAVRGGQLTALIAGDVTDSIFAVSTQATDGIFGTDDDLNFPGSFINAKVEGTIDNFNNPMVDPTAVGQAFFAQTVRLELGPVTPPNAPEAPFAPQGGPGRTPGVRGLGGFPIGPRPRVPITTAAAARAARLAASS